MESNSIHLVVVKRNYTSIIFNRHVFIKLNFNYFFLYTIPFFQKKIIKKNILFFLFFLVIFICNYSYGKFKLNNNYNYDDEVKVKIISPNFSLEDYQNETEEFQLRRLIKISNPKEDEKT